MLASQTPIKCTCCRGRLRDAVGKLAPPVISTCGEQKEGRFSCCPSDFALQLDGHRADLLVVACCSWPVK